jgi:hypothetical protein
MEEYVRPELALAGNASSVVLGAPLGTGDDGEPTDGSSLIELELALGLE